jgi:hypothetical protein
MSSITMRLAAWEKALGLLPDEEDVPYFKDVLLDVLHVDGHILFSPSDTGNQLHYKQNNRGQTSHVYEFYTDKRGLDLRGLPRFATHEVELDVDNMNNMTWRVPPIHELPWPTPVYCQEDTLIAERELALRVTSAGEDYVARANVARTAPPWVRRITRARWTAIFKEGRVCLA